MRTLSWLISGSMLNILVISSALAAEGGVTFEDIARDPDAGLDYTRQPSPELVAALDAFNARGVITVPEEVADAPNKPEGSPAVAVLDFDRDGDLDIYVTNGPGFANSLFSNQLEESGELTFDDLGAAAGVAATDQDSTGVCYGDIDNDGDYDLYVLGRRENNRLYENYGDGTFADITDQAGAGAGEYTAQACAMGDVNGDGLLDIVIGNASDWRTGAAVSSVPFALNEPDQLLLNSGDNGFEDVSETSGIRDLAFPAESGALPGAAGITLAISMVDYDQDGDIDIVAANDQGAIPTAKYGGVDRGFIHLLRNDGSGQFEDVSGETGLFRAGAWMGLDFGDFNCDGLMDLFATNLGDYFVPFVGQPYEIGDMSSRWLLGLADGTFADPGVGALTATPFGWGTVVADYDNDGDQDISFHGGANMGIALEATNRGVTLQNQRCGAQFSHDDGARSETDHGRRAVLGLAAGDLNRDGFTDFVSVSSFDTPEPNPLVPAPPAGSAAFDPTAFYVPTWLPTADPTRIQFNPLIEKAKGSLSVEINSGDNSNGWMQLRLIGTAGVTTGGAVNRDGIGAVVRFTAGRGQPVLKPVLAGSSHASQNSLDLTFGMSGQQRGTVEVLWPGGVRNRLYGVKPFERLTLPEIPCSYADDWPSQKAYRYCVKTALGELRREGLLTGRQQARLLKSALRAFKAELPSRPSPNFPFRSRHVDVLDSTMHYVDVGQGDPILLLHGNPTSSYLWRNVIPHLSKIGRVIAPDLIGMGRSGKPDIDYRFIDHSRYLEEFIKELDLSNITLVLHDWGSALGFHYASRHEDKVKALAFMEAILLPMPSLEVLPEEFAALFQALRTPGVGHDLIYDQNVFIEQVLPALTVRELGGEEMRRYRAPFLQPSSREPMLRWPNEVPIAGRPADNTEIINANNAWLRETTLPKLLIYSKTGFTAPPFVVAWAQVNLPNMQTFRLKEGLHYFQEDQPDVIGGEIARWYQDLVLTAEVR